MLSRSDCRTLFRTLTNQASKFAIQLHLGQSCFNSHIYSGKHVRVINVLSDVHVFSFPTPALSKNRPKRNAGVSPALLFGLLHHLYHLLPEQHEAVVDNSIVMVMSKQPVVELGLFSDFLQKVRQVVVNITTIS